MPRQAVPYMVPQPLEPLNSEELKFWLRIMQEHALFIKAGLPCANTDMIDEAQAFYQEFEALRVRAERVQNDKKFLELVVDAQSAVREFHQFKQLLLGLVLNCRLVGANYPLLLDHVAREAEYVLRLLDKMKDGKNPLTAASKAQENLFWLRLMADHAQFISHLLDPSERNLIRTANEFSQEFDDLYLQGRDFASMLQYHNEVAAFRRFIQDVRVAVIRLRDFKKAAHDMIKECKLVGLIPELLADHVRREAEHFLFILAMMEKGIMKNVPVEELQDMGLNIMGCMEERDSAPATMVETKDEHHEYQEYQEDQEDEEEDRPPVLIAAKPSNKLKIYKQQSQSSSQMPQLKAVTAEKTTAELLIEADNTIREDETIEINESSKNSAIIKADEIIEVETVAVAKPIVQPEIPTKQSKMSKHKVGAQWPRQLGKLLK